MQDEGALALAAALPALAALSELYLQDNLMGDAGAAGAAARSNASAALAELAACGSRRSRALARRRPSGHQSSGWVAGAA